MYYSTLEVGVKGDDKTSQKIKVKYYKITISCIWVFSNLFIPKMLIALREHGKLPFPTFIKKNIRVKVSFHIQFRILTGFLLGVHIPSISTLCNPNTKFPWTRFTQDVLYLYLTKLITDLQTRKFTQVQNKWLGPITRD